MRGSSWTKGIVKAKSTRVIGARSKTHSYTHSMYSDIDAMNNVLQYFIQNNERSRC